MKIELSKDDRFHLDEGVIHMSSELAKPIAFFPPEADPPPADAPHTATVITALYASKQSLPPKNRTKVVAKKTIDHSMCQPNLERALFAAT